MESHFGVCLANGPHCLPQPKVIKKKLDMVIIDLAAIAYLFPYHDNEKIVLSIQRHFWIRRTVFLLPHRMNNC